MRNLQVRLSQVQLRYSQHVSLVCFLYVIAKHLNLALRLCDVLLSMMYVVYFDRPDCCAIHAGIFVLHFFYLVHSYYRQTL